MWNSYRGLIGQLTAGVSWLNWLSYGKSFGIASPIVLNLGVANLTFALTFDIKCSKHCRNNHSNIYI